MVAEGAAASPAASEIASEASAAPAATAAAFGRRSIASRRVARSLEAFFEGETRGCTFRRRSTPSCHSRHEAATSRRDEFSAAETTLTALHSRARHASLPLRSAATCKPGTLHDLVGPGGCWRERSASTSCMVGSRFRHIAELYHVGDGVARGEWGAD